MRGRSRPIARRWGADRAADAWSVRSAQPPRRWRAQAQHRRGDERLSIPWCPGQDTRSDVPPLSGPQSSQVRPRAGRIGRPLETGPGGRRSLEVETPGRFLPRPGRAQEQAPPGRSPSLPAMRGRPALPRTGAQGASGPSRSARSGLVDHSNLRRNARRNRKALPGDIEADGPSFTSAQPISVKFSAEKSASASIAACPVASVKRAMICRSAVGSLRSSE